MKCIYLLTFSLISCSTVSGLNADKFKGGFYPKELKKRLAWHSRCETIEKIDTNFQELGGLGQILDGNYNVTCSDKTTKTCLLKAKAFSAYLSVICY